MQLIRSAAHLRGSRVARRAYRLRHLRKRSLRQWRGDGLWRDPAAGQRPRSATHQQVVARCRRDAKAVTEWVSQTVKVQSLFHTCTSHWNCGSPACTSARGQLGRRLHLRFRAANRTAPWSSRGKCMRWTRCSLAQLHVTGYSLAPELVERSKSLQSDRLIRGRRQRG